MADVILSSSNDHRNENYNEPSLDNNNNEVVNAPVRTEQSTVFGQPLGDTPGG